MQIMPFEDAKTYRFNPFDLTKVWPHGDYPLIEVGRMTLNRNVTDYHAEIEQAAFEPNNLVPGTGLSPDKMLLARGFSYADAHRARLGVNYKQIPVNDAARSRCTATPRTARCGSATPPTRCTRRTPRAARRPTRSAPPRCTGHADGDMVRTAYTLRPEDDDWGQAGTLVREVLDDAARDRLGAQHRRPPVRRRAASRCCRGCSSTGATSTPTSARRSRRACAPTRQRQ